MSTGDRIESPSSCTSLGVYLSDNEIPSGMRVDMPDKGQNLLNSDTDLIHSTYDVMLSHFFGLATAQIRQWVEEAWFSDNPEVVEAAQMELLTRMTFRIESLFELQFLPQHFLTDYTNLPSQIGTANLKERSGARTFNEKVRLLRDWAFPSDQRSGSLSFLTQTFERTMQLLYDVEKNVFDYFLRLRGEHVQPYSPKMVRSDKFYSSADVWKFMRDYGRAPSFIIMGANAFHEVTTSGGSSGGAPWSDFRPAMTKGGVFLTRAGEFFGELYGTKCYTVANRPPYLRSVDDSAWYFVWGSADEDTNVGWYRKEWDVKVFMDGDHVAGLEMKLNVEVGAL